MGRGGGCIYGFTTLLYHGNDNSSIHTGDDVFDEINDALILSSWDFVHVNRYISNVKTMEGARTSVHFQDTVNEQYMLYNRTSKN